MPTDHGDRLRPRKRFGQHFLHDRGVIARIVESVRIGSEETLVEIGPGRGALTPSLLARCRLLHLVELDRDLARILEKSYDDESRVTVHQQNVLTFDFRALIPPSGGDLVLVGNLPYNIASILLIRLLSVVDCIDRAVFMLQREVAQRLAAAPGSRDYGRLTVMIGRVCTIESLFNVDPTSFSPVPQVESTVIRLTPVPDQSVLWLMSRRSQSWSERRFPSGVKLYVMPLSTISPKTHFQFVASIQRLDRRC